MDVEVIIEVPQGSRNKYEMDPASGRVRLDRMLSKRSRPRRCAHAAASPLDGISSGIPAGARRAADQPALSSGHPSSLRQSRRPVPPSPATASWAFTLRSSCSRLASSASSASARSADCSRSVAAVSSAPASRPVLSE